MKCYMVYHKTNHYYKGGNLFSGYTKDAKLYKELYHAKAACRYINRTIKLVDLQILEFEMTCSAKFDLRDVM